MRRYLSDLATALLVACAVAMTGLAAWRATESWRTPASRDTRVKNWRELIAHGQRLGPTVAPVEIVEFSDFQCPFCATMASRLEALRHRHPDQIALVYRHFPIEDRHPHALAAAIASECAAAQGRFEPFHTALFSEQDSIGLRPWTAYAVTAGVPDTLRFRQCLTERAPARRVKEDVDAGSGVGVRATPTLIVNGEVYTGAVPIDELERRIDEVLRRGD